MKGQLSIEMLVVLVIILGVVALVASSLMNSANKAAEETEKRANDTMGDCTRLDQSCTSSGDCCSRNCVGGYCKPSLN